jgi:hypothetical protein
VLVGRADEAAVIDRLLAAVRGGVSGVLVLRGPAGIGKTALLEWAAGQAGDMRVARVAGVESEMDLGFAGLHQVLVPFLGAVEQLPEPQRVALNTAFGRIVTETQGNPLALLELPRGKNPAELAGDLGPLGAGRLSERIERSFRGRLAALPADTRRLVPLAAAEPTGDTALLARAGDALSVPAAAADAAADAGLLSVETQVRFLHPLVRSAAYHAASGAQRRDAHRALAEATDAATDPDRRAWHRGRAMAAPDEEVATELAESAERARKRGGVAAAGAFLQRAFELTVAPETRRKRAFAAAQAWHEAGGHDRAMELLDTLLDGPLEELERGRAEWLRAKVILIRTDRRDGAVELFGAARILESLDRDLARSCYLDVLFAFSHNAPGIDRREVARAMAALPLPERPDGFDLLLHGIGVFESQGFPHGKDVISQAVEAFVSAPVSDADDCQILSTASAYARSLWDEAACDVITARAVTLARGGRDGPAARRAGGARRHLPRIR